MKRYIDDKTVRILHDYHVYCPGSKSSIDVTDSYKSTLEFFDKIKDDPNISDSVKKQVLTYLNMFREVLSTWSDMQDFILNELDKLDGAKTESDDISSSKFN